MSKKAVGFQLRFWLAVSVSILLSSCASDKMLQRRTLNCPPVSDPAFEDSLLELAGIDLVHGNKIVELVNGEEFFPAMLRVIRSAQHNITFENFVWRSGETSTQFVEALSERARAGVSVHFLVGSLGAIKFHKSDLKKLRMSGVETAKYNPPRLTNFLRIGHRTHRKILIVDGRIGFIGGISIADEWFYETKNPGRWRDSNYQMEGPVVTQLQEIFCVNWAQATGTILRDEKYFSHLKRAGPSEAACFMSGPGEDERNSRRVYLLSIAGAQKKHPARPLLFCS